MRTQVIDELNVKDIEVIDDIGGLEEKGLAWKAMPDTALSSPGNLRRTIKEGLAREIVHRLQNMRKEADSKSPTI